MKRSNRLMNFQNVELQQTATLLELYLFFNEAIKQRFLILIDSMNLKLLLKLKNLLINKI